MAQNNIVNAPSKWSLSVAFFDKIGPSRRSVEFIVKGPNFPREQRVEVIIDKLEWEDGSGESWCFGGNMTTSTIAGLQAGSSYKGHGWFRTSNRLGWIEIDIE